MIEIDKTDSLYAYLTKIKAEDIDALYQELANNGIYKRQEVIDYFKSSFEPSITNEPDEKELEKILDYYTDIKNFKAISNKKLKDLLKEYKQSKDEKLKIEIVNSQLKDILFMCINYHSLHTDVDLQDLLEISSIALLNSIENYDEASKLDLMDYLIYNLRKEVKKEFEEKK